MVSESVTEGDSRRKDCRFFIAASSRRPISLWRRQPLGDGRCTWSFGPAGRVAGVSSDFSLRAAPHPAPGHATVRKIAHEERAQDLRPVFQRGRRGAPEPPQKSECPPSKARAKAAAAPRGVCTLLLIDSAALCAGGPRVPAAAGPRVEWGGTRPSRPAPPRWAREPAAEVRPGPARPSPAPSRGWVLGAPGGAARGGGAGTVAAAPAPARILARRHHRVQLGFVTGEQLCAAGPLSLPYPNSLLLEVHPAGEEADATVTDADSLCVFRCSLSRDTECCYVGKESILITLGYHSALLKFASHAEFSAFSNALRRYQCEKKEHSMFSFSRTEEVSAAQYFEFYDCLSQQQNVMRDFVMTATYHRAILQNHTDFRNKVVLDVGCGSGILSFFAVQAGALRVYAVEAGSVAQYAEMYQHLERHEEYPPGLSYLPTLHLSATRGAAKRERCTQNCLFKLRWRLNSKGCHVPFRELNLDSILSSMTSQMYDLGGLVLEDAFLL
ncbi:uncharacterized protein [Ovis canadensis]|uniref:uncharacterized protein n=1 Tax=Ovis canadensis TaxID=37174 RepID=UPI00375225F7